MSTSTTTNEWWIEQFVPSALTSRTPESDCIIAQQTTMPSSAFPYKWMLLSSDSSEIEMEAFIDRQKQWLKKTSQHEACQVCPVRFTQHTMHYVIYKCKSQSCAKTAQESGLPPCTWFLRTTLCDATKRGKLEQHGQHLSSAPDEQLPKLNFTMKRFIRDKVKDKYKASRILNAMIDAGFFTSNAAAFKTPVAGFAYRFRTRGLGDNNNVDEMESLLANRQYHDSLQEDAAFGFGFPTSETGQPSLSTGLKTPVVIGFATKHSIRNLRHAEQHPLHVDATFKINTARFPSIIMGISDVRRQFHPVAFFIVSSLRQPVLEMVFRETFRMYRTVTGEAPKIVYTMADADRAQRNALDQVVAEDLQPRVPPVHLMCFFHVMQNVRQYLRSVPPQLHHEALKHVYRMHFARSSTEFDARAAEAVQAWKDEPALRDFERQFSQQWLIGGFTRWQCFVTPPGHAKTNNPVEAFNKEIKRDYSLRSLVSVNAQAQAFLDMCYHRACRARPFATTPIPSDKQASRFRALERQGCLVVNAQYRSSVQYLLDGINRKVLRVVHRRAATPNRVRKTPLSQKEELALEDELMEVEEQPSWGWIVDVDGGTCECRNWRKFGYCVHLIAARLHEELPVEGIKTKRSFAIQGKQRLGRRPKVGHALSFN